MAEESKLTIPAYASYKSFYNLIGEFRDEGVPDHITRSVVKGSNSAKATMLSSLRALGLMNDADEPTELLHLLVRSEGDDGYGEALSLTLSEAYPYLFDGSIDLSNTTTEKVAEKFKEAGVQKASTLSKCVSFFLGAAKDAGVEVSGRVKAPPVPRSQGARKKSKPTARDNMVGGSDPDEGRDQDRIPSGLEKMERITVPLRGMEDGVIYFPKGLAEDEAKKAVKMANFILENFYGLE
ncbi:MAG: DUF5343 domain-containing protein [Pseudomonadota bacterium]